MTAATIQWQRSIGSIRGPRRPCYVVGSGGARLHVGGLCAARALRHDVALYHEAHAVEEDELNGVSEGEGLGRWQR